VSFPPKSLESPAACPKHPSEQGLWGEGGDAGHAGGNLNDSGRGKRPRRDRRDLLGALVRSRNRRALIPSALPEARPPREIEDPMHSFDTQPASYLPFRPYLSTRSPARRMDARAGRRHAPTGMRFGRRFPNRRAPAQPTLTAPALPARDTSRAKDVAGSRDLGAHGDDPPPRRPHRGSARATRILNDSEKQIVRSAKIVVRKHPPERA
jgi:hypothetical protein